MRCYRAITQTISYLNSIRVKLDKDVKNGGEGNNGLQEAAYGERTTERMSITTWFVCRLVITEHSLKTAATFLFSEKVEPITTSLSTEFI